MMGLKDSTVKPGSPKGTPHPVSYSQSNLSKWRPVGRPPSLPPNRLAPNRLYASAGFASIHFWAWITLAMSSITGSPAWNGLARTKRIMRVPIRADKSSPPPDDFRFPQAAQPGSPCCAVEQCYLRASCSSGAGGALAVTGIYGLSLRDAISPAKNLDQLWIIELDRRS